MKKLLLVMLALVFIISCVVFVACDNPTPPDEDPSTGENPLDPSYIEGNDFEYVKVSQKGELSWSKLKIATKYVLSVEFPDGTKMDFTIDKKQGSQNLETLQGVGAFPVGKSTFKLTAYKLEKWEIDGEKFEDELPMTDNADQFIITKINGQFSLERLRYKDDYITLTGFYSTPRTIDEESNCFLMEEKLPQNNSLNSNSITYNKSDFTKKVKVHEGYSIHFYRSKADMDSGVNEFFNGYAFGDLVEAPSGRYGSVYISITNDVGNVVATYTLKLRTLLPVTYSFWKVTVSAAGDYRKDTTKSIKSDIDVYEGDILPASLIFSGETENLYARDKNYNLITPDSDLVASVENGNRTNLYFYENQQLLQSDCEEYKAYAKDFTLKLQTNPDTTQPDVWVLTYLAYSAQSTEVTIPATIMGKPVSSFYFTGSQVTSVTLQSGYIGVINSNSFYDCTSLTTINLPSSIPSSNISTFIVGGGRSPDLTIYCEFGANYPEYANWNRVSGDSIKINTVYDQIGLTSSISVNGCLIDVSSGEGIVRRATASFTGDIPESVECDGKTYLVTTIAEGALDGQRVVNISKNILSMSLSDSLEILTVSKENQKYCAIDNILYNKNCTEIIFISDAISNSIEIVEGITAISNQFANSTITAINLPSTLMEIEVGAFSSCPNLLHISIDQDNMAFYAENNCIIRKNNKALIVSIGGQIPSTVERIEEGAFLNCSEITEIIVPLTVNIIDQNAFADCVFLKSLTVPFIKNYIGFWFGASSYQENGACVPATLNYLTIIGGKIPANAIYGCDSILNITFQENVTELGQNCLYGCTALQKVSLVFPSYSTTFPYLFGGSSPNKIKTVEILGGTMIPYRAFRLGPSIEEIIIPETITAVGIDAFYGCGLEKVNYNGTIDQWAMINFPSSSPYSNPLSLANGLYINDVEVTQINISEATSINAYSFINCTNVTNINIGASVTIIGESAFEGCANATNITIGENVTTIEKNAFANCTSVITITIGEKVSLIKDSAFLGCTNVTALNYDAKSMPNLSGTSTIFDGLGVDGIGVTLTIGADVTNIPAFLFYNNKAYGNYKDAKIINVLFEDGSICSTIGKYAFAKCNYIEKIFLPDALTRIGEYAFSDCTNLQYNEIDDVLYLGSYDNPCKVLVSTSNKESVSLEINSKTNIIAPRVFENCISLVNVLIPDSVITIGSYAFSGCSSLEIVSISESSQLEIIDSFAFNECVSLASIKVPDNVRTIGSYAFSGCSSLETVSIRESSQLQLIDSYSFNECTGLINMLIPENVQILGERAFYKCIKLTKLYYNAVSVDDLTSSSYVFSLAGNSVGFEVIFGEKVREIPDNLFYCYATYNDYNPRLIGVTFVENSVCETIGRYAFAHCFKLTSIAIPKTVRSIKEAAFYNCSGLSSIILPDGLDTISNHMFYGCSKLESITIGNSIKWIREYCFNGASKLTSINYLGTIEQWNNAIKFISDWDNNTGNYTITCTDGTISKDGTVTYN